MDSLVLGEIFPNAPRTVLATDAASGSFLLQGVANAEVVLTFVLPGDLRDGPSTLPIAFGATAAAYNPAGVRSGSTVFNPGVPRTARLHNASGLLGVFMGATVTPTSQPSGHYTGTITLNAAYTGN